MRRKQTIILAIGEEMKNTFFCRKAQTIDLTELFQTIDPKKLKRTSSAVWRKPPRFTLMPGLNSTLDATLERNDESTDDE